LTVDVLFRPSCSVSHELQGEEMLLKCSAVANPEDTVFYWSKDDVTFSGQGEGMESKVRLRLTNETTGTYYCHVNNTVGEDTCHLEITEMMMTAGISTMDLSFSLWCWSSSSSSSLSWPATSYTASMQHVSKVKRKEDQKLRKMDVLRIRATYLMKTCPSTDWETLQRSLYWMSAVVIHQLLHLDLFDKCFESSQRRLPGICWRRLRCPVCGGSYRLQGRQHAACVGEKAKDGSRRRGSAVNNHHLYHHPKMSWVANTLVN